MIVDRNMSFGKGGGKVFGVVLRVGFWFSDQTMPMTDVWSWLSVDPQMLPHL